MKSSINYFLMIIAIILVASCSAPKKYYMFKAAPPAPYNVKEQPSVNENLAGLNDKKEDNLQEEIINELPSDLVTKKQEIPLVATTDKFVGLENSSESKKAIEKLILTKSENLSINTNKSKEISKFQAAKQTLKIAREVNKLEKAYKKDLAEDAEGSKSQLVALLLAIFVGAMGIHRFYLGYTTIGILQLITLGGCGIWSLVDLIRIITGDLKPADGSEYDPEL
ncbi:MAG: TM2 domain-containing protein [Cyclobacteriaceae bacterium]|nr:TM2 domain-containing protein [Cyclobacteriaceae bacterium]